MFPKRVHLWSQWSIHSFIFVRVPSEGALPRNGRKHTVTVCGAPCGWKTYLQWGAAWFLKGIVCDTAITTPVPCSPRHDTFHLGLGRPEPLQPACVVLTLNRIYPPHLLLPPTWPRVN
jgi:hypothetical protein